MAIIIQTQNPLQLNERIRQLVVEYPLLTWEVDTDNDYTLILERWRYRAWMRPNTDRQADGELQFGIVSSTRYPMTTTLYAVYHARFAEFLLSHFDREIQSLSITPNLSEGVDIY